MKTRKAISILMKDGDTSHYKDTGDGTLRVIMNRKRLNFMVEDKNYEEIIILASKITDDFLRHLYRDPLISEYKLMKQLSNKDHSFDKETEVLYFYCFYNK